MIPATQARQILAQAELIYTAAQVNDAVTRLAAVIEAKLGDAHPLVLSVMGGAVVFTGHLLPMLRFPLDFDIIRASRYGAQTVGGQLRLSLLPQEDVARRTVLVLDDILDEGRTLLAIREALLQLNAARVLFAVLVEKDTGQHKPIQADFVGLTVPNRYVFGFGMDVYGAWRNLPAIYALREQQER